MPGESILKYVSPGEPVSATHFNNIIRFLRSLTSQPGLFVDATGMYQRRMRERAVSGGSGGSTAVRYGILRSTLIPSVPCTLEEYEYDASHCLQLTGRIYRAFDPFNELYGTKDATWFYWFVDPNGPTDDVLGAADGDFPEDAVLPTETEIATLERKTCEGFTGGPSQCAGET